MQKQDGIKQFYIKQLKKSFLIKVIGALLSFIIHIIPARMLTLDHYSAYSFILSWFFVLLLISKLGIDITTVKYVASLKNNLDKAKLKGFIKKSFISIMFSSFIVTIFSLIILFFLKNKNLITYYYTFTIFFLIIPISTMQDYISAAFRGYNKIIHSELPDSIIKPLLIILLIYLFIFYEINLSSVHFALIYFFACVIILILSSSIFYNNNISNLKNIKSIKFDNLLKNSLPILLGGGLYLVIIQTDIIMLGFISESTNVGLYAPAAKISSFIFFIVSIFTVFTSSLFSELYKSKNYDKLKKIIKMTTIYSSIIAFVFLILILFFGKFLLSLYGYQFTSSYIAMLILTISYFFITITVAREFMIMTDLHNESAIIIFITLLFNIILNYILISQYGINGAAIATALSLFLMNIIMTFVVYKKTSINPTIFQ